MKARTIIVAAALCAVSSSFCAGAQDRGFSHDLSGDGPKPWTHLDFQDDADDFHITWVTMTKDGPVVANLTLDGILPGDWLTPETTRAKFKPFSADAKGAEAK